MSVHSEIKRVTTESFRKMKFDNEKITMLTAYDFSIAKMVDAGGVDAVLVGDSASNVMAGHETTLPITLDRDDLSCAECSTWSNPCAGYCGSSFWYLPI